VTADKYARYRADPVAFCREVLRFEPWSKQREILEAVRDHDRVAVRACNASGKTAGASAVVLWSLAGGPGSVVITTAPTERQVKKLLWREVARRHRAARGFFHGATLTDTELYLAPDWFATGLSTDDTGSFQGWHGARTLVIVDEASGVDERIFEAIEGVLAGGHAKLLLISNPLRTSGQFYRAFTSERDLWHRITISAHDTPAFTREKVPREVGRRLVSRRWVGQAEKKWGPGSPLYAVRVLGEFPSTSDDTVPTGASSRAIVDVTKRCAHARAGAGHRLATLPAIPHGCARCVRVGLLGIRRSRAYDQGGFGLARRTNKRPGDVESAPGRDTEGSAFDAYGS
jgi:hypothetical protein